MFISFHCYHYYDLKTNIILALICFSFEECLYVEGAIKEEGRKEEEVKEEVAASAEPPTLTPHKEDYDSSATVSTTRF